MNSLEFQLNDPDPDSKAIEKYSNHSKIIIFILIISLIILFAGFIIILILYLKEKDDDEGDKPEENKNISENEIIILYNLSYATDKIIRNSFKEGEINYNETIGNINNGLDYNQTERNIYDLYIPYSTLHKKNKYNKIILYIHGGGFFGGNKTYYEKDCKTKTKLGYICASMNYNYLRLYYAPDYTIFRILDEITSVQKAIKQFLKLQGFDENKLEICLAGGSAGAQLSLLYAYWLGKNSPIPIKFVLNMVAPVTFESDYFWRYKEEIGPLDRIEPEDIQKAIESKKILNSEHMYYNSTYLAIQMNFFLGRGASDNFEYMIISPGNWDINRTNENFTKLLNASKILFPVNHINRYTLPTLCFYGGKDIDVGVYQYAYLRIKFNESGNNDNLTLIYSKFSSHSSIDTNTTNGIEAIKYLESNFTEFTNKYFSKE